MKSDVTTASMTEIMNFFRPKSLAETRVAQAIRMDLLNPPHTIFHGGPGSGKYTVADLWIRRSFGRSFSSDEPPQVTEQLRKREWTFKTPAKVMSFNVWSCKTHFVVNPSMLGNNDRHFLQQFVESVCDTANVSAYDGTSNQGVSDYKVIMISNADLLSSAAQHSIKCIMETSVHNCRFVLLTRSLSKLIDAISSRCIKIKVGLAEAPAMKSMLVRVESEVGVELPPKVTCEIVETSKGSWKKFWSLLSFAFGSHPYVITAPGSRSGSVTSDEANEPLVRDIVNALMRDQSIENFLSIRDKVYSLLNIGLSPSFICCGVTVKVLTKLDNSISADQKAEVLRIACLTDMRASRGRPIIHIEWFLSHLLDLCMSRKTSSIDMCHQNTADAARGQQR